MNKEHYYTPVDLSLWDVCKPHIIDGRLKQIELLHVFGEKGDKAIFVTSEDKVYATGTDLENHLGICNEARPNELIELAGFSHQNIKCFSSGDNFTIALTTNGRLLSCGDNSHGQLGIGTRKKRGCICSVVIPKEERIVSIQCGSHYSLALSSSNKVYEWGWDGYDKIDAIRSPQLISYFEAMAMDICQISCCGYNYAALEKNGLMFEWTKDSGIRSNSSWQVSAMGCSLDGFIYIQNGDLFKDEHLITKADDFVVHQDYICIKRKNHFYLHKYDNESPVLLSVSNFQSAFANHWCPQFVRRSLNDSTSNTKDGIISDRNIYKTLYNNKDLSDLTIKLSNGVIYVHKTILMCFSEHFKRILTGPWAASNSTEMDMTSYNAVAYETFLKYIYSGILYGKELTESDLIDLYNIAESYFENDLKENVLEVFKDFLTFENVCELYCLADKQMPFVEECLKFAGVDLAKVVVTEGYLRMQPEHAMAFTIECATRNLKT